MGPDPATESLIGAPIATNALPGLLAALILGLAGGVSLGPEHPIMVVNIALAVALGSRLFPRVSSLDWTILAASGTIGALFGTPVAAALIFRKRSITAATFRYGTGCSPAAGGGGRRIDDRYFSIPISLCQSRTIRTCASSISSAARLSRLSPSPWAWSPWCLPRLRAHPPAEKSGVNAGNRWFLLGIPGVIGGHITLFKGLDEMQQLASSQTLGAGDFLLIAVVKLAALVLASACGFRGGRIFPAVFVGVSLGLMLHAHVEAVPAAITISCAILGLVLVVTRDGWLSLFMASVVVPDTTLLPLLCIVMLPAATAGREAVDDCQTPRRLAAVVAIFQRLGDRA